MSKVYNGKKLNLALIWDLYSPLWVWPKIRHTGTFSNRSTTCYTGRITAHLKYVNSCQTFLSLSLPLSVRHFTFLLHIGFGLQPVGGCHRTIQSIVISASSVVVSRRFLGAVNPQFHADNFCRKTRNFLQRDENLGRDGLAARRTGGVVYQKFNHEGLTLI